MEAKHTVFNVVVFLLHALRSVLTIASKMLYDTPASYIITT